MNTPNYTSSYIKTEYYRMVYLKNPFTGEIRESSMRRIVYKNTQIDPDLVIPLGTVIGNETTTKEMTNLDRMKKGKPPLILICDEKGNITYDRIELHHLTSEELKQQTDFFNGEITDGTLVEIPSSIHRKYNKQLHAINANHGSFRKGRILYIDENGRTVRGKKKTYDAYQYDAVRKRYWKDRAAVYEMQKSKIGGIEMDRYQDKSPEEQKKIQQSQLNALNRWKARTNAKKSTTEEEGKGQRERDRGREHNQDNGKGQSKDRGQSR